MVCVVFHKRLPSYVARLLYLTPETSAHTLLTHRLGCRLMFVSALLLADGFGEPAPVLRIDPAQLEAEVADLQDERERAARDKNTLEQQYLEQVIMVSGFCATLHVPVTRKCVEYWQH